MNTRPFTHEFETITWEECARLVQADSSNRKIAERRVASLSRSVENRRFLVTHQGVAMSVLTLAVFQAERLAAAKPESEPAKLPLPAGLPG